MIYSPTSDYDESCIGRACHDIAMDLAIETKITRDRCWRFVRSSRLMCVTVVRLFI